MYAATPNFSRCTVSEDCCFKVSLFGDDFYALPVGCLMINRFRVRIHGGNDAPAHYFTVITNISRGTISCEDSPTAWIFPAVVGLVRGWFQTLTAKVCGFTRRDIFHGLLIGAPVGVLAWLVFA